MTNKQHTFAEKIQYFFLSLVISLLLYVYVQNEKNPYIKKTFELYPQIKLQTKNAKIISKIPKIKIVLEGKKDIMLSLKETDVKPFIVVDNNTNNKVKSQIRLLAPKEVDLIKLDPEYIDLRIAKIISQTFNVEPIFISQNDYQQIKIEKIIPGKIIVKGYINKIQAIKKVVILVDSNNLISQFKSYPLAINLKGKVENDLEFIPDKILVQTSTSPITSKLVYIKAVVNGYPAADYEIKSINVFPAKVLVLSPHNEISQITEINTSEINIQGISADLSLEVPLEKPNEEVQLQTNKVKVEIKVGKTKEKLKPKTEEDSNINQSQPNADNNN